MESDRELILKELIRERCASSNGSCGIGFPELCAKSGIPSEEVKNIVRRMVAAKEARARQGIHGILIFKRH